MGSTDLYSTFQKAKKKPKNKNSSDDQERGMAYIIRRVYEFLESALRKVYMFNLIFKFVYMQHSDEVSVPTSESSTISSA